MAKNMTCPKCRAVFSWNEKDTVTACPQCGTRYRMHPQKNRSAPVLMPSVGRGEVDYLTVPHESTIRNRPLMKSYIPNNWKVQCGLANDRFDLVSNPVVLSAVFSAPNGSAQIVFTGESFYKHFEPTPQNAALQNRLEDLTVSRSPSFFRLKTYHSAGDYCDALAQNCGCRSLSLLSEKQPDAEERSRQQKIIQGCLSKGFLNPAADWAGRTYQGTANGQRMKIYAETRVIRLMRTAVVQNVQMQPMPGMFGMRMVPQMVQQQVQELFWDTNYEFTLLAAENAFDQAMRELAQIAKTLDYLPDMETVRAEAMAMVQNAQMNIAQNQAASWDRQSRIIADTNAYTSQIQHQMMADNAASHDRVANLHSEMIREVNTYHGRDGVVEASTQFDHVYQHRQYPDVYAASQGDALEFGVDFEELPRTNGDY